MKGKKARFLALLAAAVAVGSVATPAGAQTAVTYEVLTGAPVPGTEAFDFHMFPSALTAHPGDTLHFDWGSVALLPVGTTEPPFAGFFAADPDDNGFKIDGSLFFPTAAGSGCGLRAGNPCIYDGSALLYPGDQNFKNGFYVRIAESLDDAQFLVSNMFHTLTVTVDSAAQQSPAEDPNLESHLDASAQEAQELLDMLNDVQYETDEYGKRTYTAYMGYDTDHISFFEAFPQDLRIRKGDKVEWNFAQNVVEPHTATTPPAKAKKWGEAAFSGAPVCDPDGDEGTAPDERADFENPMLCDAPAVAELDLPNKFAKEQGDGKVPTGGNRDGDYDTSGLRGGPEGIPDDAYSLQFTRKSRDLPFTVMCSIHWNMKTKVTVR
jgi:plastocyanin